MYRSINGKVFDTEAEALAENKRWAISEIEHDKTQAQILDTTSTATPAQFWGCGVLLLLCVLIPCAWPLWLGLSALVIAAGGKK